MTHAGAGKCREECYCRHRGRATYNGVGHLQHLLKQRVGLLVAAARVDNNYLKVFRLKLLDAFLSNDDRIGFCIAT